MPGSKDGTSSGSAGLGGGGDGTSGGGHNSGCDARGYGGGRGNANWGAGSGSNGEVHHGQESGGNGGDDAGGGYDAAFSDRGSGAADRQLLRHKGMYIRKSSGHFVLSPKTLDRCVKRNAQPIVRHSSASFTHALKANASSAVYSSSVARLHSPSVTHIRHVPPLAYHVHAAPTAAPT
jgi:hypothetical protein